MGSWKTTLGGIVVGLGIVFTALTPLVDGNPDTAFAVSEAWPVIATGLGAMGLGWFARDNDKSSEDVGTN